MSSGRDFGAAGDGAGNMITGSRYLFIVMLALSISGCTRVDPPGAPAVRSAQAAQDPEPASSAQVAEKVRPAAVAGLFYPAGKSTLSNRIDELLNAARSVPIKTLRGLVVPHAGYEFSGPTAAEGFKQLVGREFHTVIVMAPSHYAEFRGAFVSDSDAYETPLGQVRLAAWTGDLARTEPFVSRPRCRVERPAWSRQSPRSLPAPGEDLPDTWEHSLEVQVPFLQKTLSDFQLIPIIFGEVDPQAVAVELAKRLDDKTLLVASSDLSHFYPDKKARDLDTTCVEAVCQLNCAWMEEQEACGKQPILALMHVARAKGWQAKLLDYRTSADTAGDRSQVVGYAAIAFFEPESQADTTTVAPAVGWTPAEQSSLLKLARQSLDEAVRAGKAPEPDPAAYGPRLCVPRACFVTLTKRGELRGCIGHIFPREPLVKAVAHNAASAALHDPRFLPVSTAELAEIDMEISVLTLPERLEVQSPEDLLAKLRPHVDGVVLRVGPRQSTYLPQVWEQLPDKESFMSHLADKAGLATTDWKRGDAEVLVYQVEAFHEREEAKPAEKEE